MCCPDTYGSSQATVDVDLSSDGCWYVLSDLPDLFKGSYPDSFSSGPSSKDCSSFDCNSDVLKRFSILSLILQGTCGNSIVDTGVTLAIVLYVMSLLGNFLSAAV